MKKFFVFFFLLSSGVICEAQDTTAVPEKLSRRSSLQIYGNVNADMWMNNPDSIKFNIPKSRGGGIYARYDIPFGTSKLGFSPGLGICSYNLSTDGAISYVTDTVTLKESTVFNKIAASYKLNKLVANYAEVPVEFFYMTKTNIPLRIAAGFKGGYLVSSHTKFKKDSSTKDKAYYIHNLTKIRYGATFSVTYGWFGLNGFYSLTPLFEKNLGPDATPFSVGITIAPY